MTVRELINFLQEFDANDLVVLAADEEGNCFSTVSIIVEGMYRDYGSRGGDVKLRTLEGTEGYTEEDVGRPENGYQPCVTLWPLN